MRGYDAQATVKLMTCLNVLLCAGGGFLTD